MGNPDTVPALLKLTVTSSVEHTNNCAAENCKCSRQLVPERIASVVSISLGESGKQTTHAKALWKQLIYDVWLLPPHRGGRQG